MVFVESDSVRSCEISNILMQVIRASSISVVETNGVISTKCMGVSIQKVQWLLLAFM